MDAEELFVHNRDQRKSIKSVHALVVNFLVVLDDAFLAEGEMLGQMAAFVIASEEEDRIRVADLEAPEIKHTLDGRISTINIVAKKQVLCPLSLCLRILDGPADGEKFKEIVKLPVNISAHRYCSIHVEDIFFFGQDFPPHFENFQGTCVVKSTFAL